jgi:hypothetical protein
MWTGQNNIYYVVTYTYKKIQENMHIHEPNSENIFAAGTQRECYFLSNVPPMPVLRSTIALEVC